MLRPEAVFVSAISPDAASGGGAYARTVLRLLRRIYGEDRLAVIAPSPFERRSFHSVRARAVVRSIFTGRPSRVEFACLSGLGAVLDACPSVPAAGTLVVNGVDSGVVLDHSGVAPDKVVLICHNIESDLFREQVERLAWPARILLRDVLRDVGKFERFEIGVLHRADLVVCISSVDADWIAERFPEKQVLHVPPLFEATGDPRPARCRGRMLRLGFMGRMSWWPNRDALDWLVKDVLDPMPCGRELHLFGAGTEAWHNPEAAIIAHGFVEDIAEVWRNVDLMLCPMRVGGGVNVKLAESLFNGVPVLATPFALRGLGLADMNAAGLRTVDGADGWKSFLGSEQADELGLEVPDEGSRAKFAVADYVLTLRHALGVHDRI